MVKGEEWFMIKEMYRQGVIDSRDQQEDRPRPEDDSQDYQEHGAPIEA